MKPEQRTLLAMAIGAGVLMLLVILWAYTHW